MMISSRFFVSIFEPCHGCTGGMKAGHHSSWWPKALHFHRERNPSHDSGRRWIPEKRPRAPSLTRHRPLLPCQGSYDELHARHKEQSAEKFPKFSFFSNKDSAVEEYQQCNHVPVHYHDASFRLQRKGKIEEMRGEGRGVGELFASKNGLLFQSADRTSYRNSVIGENAMRDVLHKKRSQRTRSSGVTEEI